MRGARAAIVCLLPALVLSGRPGKPAAAALARQDNLDAIAYGFGTLCLDVPPGTPIGPGDTIPVGERWF